MIINPINSLATLAGTQTRRAAALFCLRVCARYWGVRPIEVKHDFRGRLETLQTS